jgi:hypothetical protein
MSISSTFNPKSGPEDCEVRLVLGAKEAVELDFSQIRVPLRMDPPSCYLGIPLFR